MADPFLAEIRLMSFVYAPQGWALCNGQFLPINQNQGLFSLLGTTFGGNGQTTFALPDLRGRTPMHVGSGHTLGERGGEPAHTITTAEMPQHTHVLQASPAAANTFVPTANVLARGATNVGANPLNLYASSVSNLVAMQPGELAGVGGSQAHLNMQPFLTISFSIALQGIFPSPN